MSRAKQSWSGYVVKDPKTGMYLDDEGDLVGLLEDAEHFLTKQDAENYRDTVAYHTTITDGVIVKIRLTFEEI